VASSYSESRSHSSPVSIHSMLHTCFGVIGNISNLSQSFTSQTSKVLHWIALKFPGMFFFCFDVEPARGVACLFLTMGLFLLSFFQVLNIWAAVSFLAMFAVSFFWSGTLRYEAATVFATTQGFALLFWSSFLSVLLIFFPGDPYSKKYLPSRKFDHSSVIAIVAASFLASFHSFYAAWVFRCFRKFIESQPKHECQLNA